MKRRLDLYYRYVMLLYAKWQRNIRIIKVLEER